MKERLERHLYIKLKKPLVASLKEFSIAQGLKNIMLF